MENGIVNMQWTVESSSNWNILVVDNDKYGKKNSFLRFVWHHAQAYVDRMATTQNVSTNNTRSEQWKK